MKTIEENAIENGQRNKMTQEDLQAFLGEEDGNNIDRVYELLLDVVNDIYSVKDLTNDVNEYKEG